MATIGRVNAVFTASTGGLTAGVEAAGRAFKTLGGDSSALRNSLNALQAASKQSFAEIGPAAEAARAAFDTLSAAAAKASAEFKAGTISSEQFAASMVDVTLQAKQYAQAVADAAAITRDNITAEQTYFKELDRIKNAVQQGGLAEEVAATARERAYQVYLRAAAAADKQASSTDALKASLTGMPEFNIDIGDPSAEFEAAVMASDDLRAALGANVDALRATAAAAEVARESEEYRQELMARGAEIARQVATASQIHADAIQELDELMASGAIKQDVYNAAVARQDEILARADGSMEAAAQASRDLAATQERGAAVTRANMTAQEAYAAEVADLQGLLRAGAITQQTFNRAVASARSQMQASRGAATQMASGISAITSRLNVMIGLEVARFFASITSSIASAIGSLVRFAAAEADVVEDTAKLADRLGMTYGEMAGLRAAGELVGVGMEQIGKAVTKADVALVKASSGSKTAQKAFADLGLNIDELAGMNGADRFNAIAEAIAELPTEAQRSAAAVQLFGRAGAELLPLFNEGADAIRQAREEAERFGLTLTGQQAKNVDTMNDSFDRARQAIAGVVQQVTAFLAPAITGVVNQFNAFVANIGGANIGQAIGEGILDGAEYLAGIADWIVSNFNGAFEYLSRVGEQWGGVFNFLSRTVSFLSGVFNAAQAGFLLIVRAFSGTFETLATIAQKIGQFLGFDTDTIDQLVAGAQAFNAEIDRGITNSINAASEGFGDAFAADAKPVGQAVAGPFVTALRDARQQARDAVDAVDEVKKAPVEITQEVEVTGIAQALKGVDSRSQEGISEMFRIMRGDTGNVQEQMLDALETIVENTGSDDTVVADLAGA